jgi:hypothetical protein
VNQAVQAQQSVELILNRVKAVNDRAVVIEEKVAVIEERVGYMSREMRNYFDAPVPAQPSGPPPVLMDTLGSVHVAASEALQRIEAMERAQIKIIGGLESLSGSLRAEHKIMKDEFLQVKDMVGRLLLRPICSCGSVAGSAAKSGGVAAPVTPVAKAPSVAAMMASAVPIGTHIMAPREAVYGDRPPWEAGEVRYCTHPVCDECVVGRSQEAVDIVQSKGKAWFYRCARAVAMCRGQ